jgi:hypothetical protein
VAGPAGAEDEAGARRALAWREPAGVGLGLLGLTFAVFFPLVRGRILFERDILTYWVSQVETFVRTVGAGSWPVWDPWVSFGQPMLAQPDTQVLYPFTWLNLVLPLRVGYSAFALFHLWISGIGLYRLGRRLGTTHRGALAAAAIWMLSGPFLSLANVWHHFAGAAWMPWVVDAAVATAASAGGRAQALRWGVLLAVQVLAGSADTVALTAALAGLLAVDRVLRVPRAERRLVRVAVAAAGATVLGLGLSAALWIPTLDVARHSARWSLPASVQTYWSLHPLSLLQIGLPLFLVDLPLRPEWRQTVFEGREPFLESVYVGLPALGLAAAALAARARRSGLLGGAALALTAVALGRHSFVYVLALKAVPVLGILRYPQKAMVAVALALALLCGSGYDAWARDAIGRVRRGLAVALGVATLGVGALLAWVHFGAEAIGAAALLPSSEAGAPYPELLRPVAVHLALALATTAGAGLAAALAALGRLSPGRSAAAIATFAVAGLLAAHATLHPTAPPALLAARSPVLDVLPGGLGTRVLPYDYGQVPGSSERYLGRPSALLVDRAPRGWSYREAVAFGLQQYLVAPMAARYGAFGSFDVDHRGLYPRELDALTALAWSLDGAPLARLRLLQQGGVSHVVALHSAGFEALREIARFPSVYAEPLRVFAVPQPQPRAYLAEGLRVATGPEALATLVDPSFDFRREVLIEEGSRREPHPEDPGACRIVDYRPDRVEIDVDARRPAVAVLLDSYDPGWRAALDGSSVPVLRANVAFRAVAVPPGRHRVRMEYRPRALTAGLVVTALAAGALIVALLARRRAPRPSAGEGGLA